MGRSIGLGADAAKCESTKCTEKRVTVAIGDQGNLQKHVLRRRLSQSNPDKLAICIQEGRAYHNTKHRVLAGLNHPPEDVVLSQRCELTIQL